MKVNVCFQLAKPSDFEIDVGETYTTEDVKREIQTKTGVPPKQQCVVYCGKKLLDGRTLGDYGITEGSNLIVIRGSS